jgi:ABC-type lipoprotein export system ATPase subunit
LILDLLRRLTRQQKTATIMATHSVEGATLADVVVRLRDGQIAEMIRR